MIRRNLPFEKIEKSFTSNEGFKYEKRDDEIIEELIENFNLMVEYLETEGLEQPHA